MKQTILATKIGKSIQHVSDVKVGRSKFSPETAVLAETITGISRMKWLWPKEYGDPWPELSSLPVPPY